MLFAAIIFGVVGMLLLVFGLLIWRKQRISLLHDYHYDKVKEEKIYPKRRVYYGKKLSRNCP